MKPTIKPLLIFLSVLSLAGCAVVWLATSGYGAGLSSDAIRIISAGQNVFHGYGLETSSGDPLIFCPPYYSILLGVLSFTFRSDVFTVGMILNILTFGNIIFWSGILFMLIQPSQPLLAMAASLVVASSPSLIRISANVAPDPLFTLFVIWFLIAAVRYLHSPTTHSLACLLVTALLAASQRYVGLAVVLTGALLILWQWRHRPWRGIWHTAIFSLLSSAPTLGYIFFHNYLGYGTLTGPRFDPNPLGNIRIAFEKLVHWFIPGTITSHTGIWLWVGLGIIFFLIGLVLAWKNGRLKALCGSTGLPPALVFLFVYGLTLIFMLSYKEHRLLLWDRIHVVILVPLLVFLLELLPSLIPPLPALRAYWLRWLLLAGFAVWLVYPAISVYKYVADSIENGEASLYNIHNTRSIRESYLAHYLAVNPFDDYQLFFSNYNETAWFLIRQNVSGIPTLDKADDWRMEPGSYLIWFNLPELNYMPKTLLTLEQISERIPLEPVYSGVDGSIYRICQSDRFPRCSEYH